MNFALETPVLQPVETTVVAATVTPLVIRDFFKKNTQVKFATVYAQFEDRFFRKTEEPIAELTYLKYKLLRIAPDGAIITELGGEAKAEGTVTAALEFVKKQGHGEPGILQTNGYANIFYARDRKGVLCAIRLGLADDGWVIDAIPVEDPSAWNGQHLIFCPRS